MLHIWHEDLHINSATHQLWQFFINSNVDTLLNNVELVGFDGCCNVYNAVHECIKHGCINKDDKYLIILDVVVDNSDVMKNYSRLQKEIEEYENIIIADIVCIEAFILNFRYFKSWVTPIKRYKNIDYIMKCRDSFLKAVKSGCWFKSRLLRKYVMSKKKTKKATANTTLEQLAAYLLQDATSYGIFKINKTVLGSCWVSDCCTDSNKGRYICNIFNKNKSSKNKADTLYRYTDAQEIINKIMR